MHMRMLAMGTNKHPARTHSYAPSQQCGDSALKPHARAATFAHVHVLHALPYHGWMWESGPQATCRAGLFSHVHVLLTNAVCRVCSCSSFKAQCVMSLCQKCSAGQGHACKHCVLSLDDALFCAIPAATAWVDLMIRAARVQRIRA